MTLSNPLSIEEISFVHKNMDDDSLNEITFMVRMKEHINKVRPDITVKPYGTYENCYKKMTNSEPFKIKKHKKRVHDQITESGTLNNFIKHEKKSKLNFSRRFMSDRSSVYKSINESDKFKLWRAPGDGSCGFHCWVEALSKKGIVTTVNMLRKEVADNVTEEYLKEIKVFYSAEDENGRKDIHLSRVSELLVDTEKLKQHVMSNMYFMDAFAIRVLEKKFNVLCLVVEYVSIRSKDVSILINARESDEPRLINDETDVIIIERCIYGTDHFDLLVTVHEDDEHSIFKSVFKPMQMPVILLLKMMEKDKNFKLESDISKALKQMVNVVKDDEGKDDKSVIEDDETNSNASESVNVTNYITDFARDNVLFFDHPNLKDGEFVVKVESYDEVAAIRNHINLYPGNDVIFRIDETKMAFFVLVKYTKINF